MTKTVYFNPVFKPCHDTKCRYVLMKGSAGSGKSADTAQYYALKLLSRRGINLLAIRKIYESHRNSVFAELQAAISRMGLQKYFTCISSPFSIRCTNGNRVLFAGCNDARQLDKLKSVCTPDGKITDIWIEEATELSRDEFQIIDDRLRGRLDEGLYYQIRMTFNPVSASHWLKKEFFDRPDPNVFTHHSTYLDNRFCDRQYHARMERRRLTDPEGYRVYGLGEWGQTDGLILPNIVIERFDVDADRFDSVSAGQDFGFNNPNAIITLGLRDGEVYVRSELYMRGADTAEIIRAARQMPGLDGVIIYCDSAEPDRIHSFVKAGFRAVGAHKSAGSVRADIDWLKQRKIHLHPDCVNTIYEIEKWSWSRGAGGEWLDTPVAFDDHAMSALRYGTQPWRRSNPHKKEATQVALPPHAQLYKPPAWERDRRIEII